MADPQLEHHRRFNRETAEAWAWFAGHRARVTSELVRAGTRWLGIWGAGNCNDLDLRVLLHHYQRVTLYDLDHQAMLAGLNRQLPAAEHGRVELITADATQWGSRAESSNLLRRHEVIASVCLLSQLCHYAQLAAGLAAADAWPQVVEPLRGEHVRLLLQMTEPAGKALLFNDFVSSDTCSELTTCDESELPRTMRRELAAGNFFTGMNPVAIEHFLATSLELRGRIARHDLSRPWRWRIGEQRSYAVCVHRIDVA